MKGKAKQSRRVAALLAILVLLLGLLPVGAVFAQDEGTPTEEPAAEEPAAEEPAPEEEPAAEEAPAEGESADEEAPAEEEAVEEPAEEGTAEEMAEEEAVEEAVDEAVAEAVEAIAESGAVLKDGNGEDVPLASEEAAEVLAAPDPMYCPPGEVYGGPTCSPARATMAEAIADAAGNGGTIFVEGGTFDGFELTGFNGGDLLIVGGEGGGTTTFDSQIYIHGNSANITLSSFEAYGQDAGYETDGTSGNASDNTPTLLVLDNSGTITLEYLLVYHENDSAVFVDDHSGDVILDNVVAVADGNDDGTYINNTDGTGEVVVENSYFESDEEDGLKVKSAGRVKLDNVVASNSGEDGADIDNSFGDGNVTVMNSWFMDNYGTGLKIKSNGWITLYNVEASDNKETGAYLETSGHYVVVQNSYFNDYDPVCEEFCEEVEYCKWKKYWDWGCWCWHWYQDCHTEEECHTECEPDYSQNIGLYVRNTNTEMHETTLCDVVAKWNDDMQIKLKSPDGDMESMFLYNLCNIDTEDDCPPGIRCGCGGCDEPEIKVYGGEDWDYWTCDEGEYYAFGSCWTGCWNWAGFPEHIEGSNLTVRYWNVIGEIWTQEDVNLIEDPEVCCIDCDQPACGDGFVQPNEECDDGNQVDDDACSNECTVEWDVALELDPYCVQGDDGWRMQWIINNPNPFNVGVNWALSDGQGGAATLTPGVNFITTSELGTWTLTVTWGGGGFAEMTYTINSCEQPDDDGDVPEFAGGGLLIPVTGEDLAALSLLPFGGTLLLGISMLVKGLYRKIKK